MKFGIILIMLLLGNSAMAQTNIIWEINNSCKHQITNSDQDTIRPQDFQIQSATLNVRYGDTPFRIIKYKKKEGNGAANGWVEKKPLEIGAISGQSSISMRLNYNNGIIQFENDTEEMSYPVEIEVILHDSTTCKLTLGNRDSSRPESEDFPKTNVNIFQGVKSNNSSFNASEVEIDEFDAFIVLDCSAFGGGKSGIYRRKRDGGLSKIRQAKYLHVDDNVGIMLTNFNHYLFKAFLEDHLLDFEYGTGLGGRFFQEADSTSYEGTKAAGGAPSGFTNSPLLRLLEYAEAANQMEEFIQSVKTDPNPNSKLLDENKEKILDNIDGLEIGNGSDVNTLYKLLSESDQEKYADVFGAAKKFEDKRLEIRLLTYTVKVNILPIQIEPYDKLVLHFTIKNQKDQLLERREYEFMIFGGWQVNQSFGVVGHGIFDDEYSLRAVPGKDTIFAEINGIRIQVSNINGELVDSISQIRDITNQQIILDNSPSRISLGFTTLTHMYYRMGKWSLGPELGVSVDFFPKSNIRYLAGGSLMFMDGRFRVSLDGGCAFGKAMVLSSNQKSNDILGTSATSANLVEKSMRSFYVGLSWNIPLNKKDTQTTN